MKKLPTRIVQITVDGTGIHTPGKVSLGKSQDKVQIIWRIFNTDWSFTDDGITIAWNFGQFVEPERYSRREYRWKSLNTNTKYYDYTINLTNGRTFSSLDPGIQNGGRK